MRVKQFQIQMQDSTTSGLNGGNKAIKVSPDDLTFDQLITGVEQSQTLTLRNTLNATVDITLKTSNNERIQIEPKTQRLAPFESCTAEVTAKINKPTQQNKQVKFKELVKIQSAYFDQKVNVFLIQSPNPFGSNHLTSVESSARSKFGADGTLSASSLRPLKKQGGDPRRDSKSPIRIADLTSKEEGAASDLEKELESKDSQIEELRTQLKLVEDQLAAVQSESANQLEKSSQDSNEQYLEQVRALLAERNPDVEKYVSISLIKERKAQEYKDEQVLKILKERDRQIEELQTYKTEQESNYGKLAQAYQELRKKHKILEEQEESLNIVVQDLEERLEAAQTKLEAYESGKEYRRLIENEERFKEAAAYIEQLEQEVQEAHNIIQQKASVEVYYSEMMQRSKDQLAEKEAKISEISHLYENEKEKRIREEEQVKLHLTSIRQDANHSLVYDRIDQLQSEKSELLKDVESLQKTRLSLEDQLRYMIDRLAEFRPNADKVSTIHQKQSVLEILSSRIEDLIAFSKEVFEENHVLVDHTTEMKSLQSQKEHELQVAISDNKKLSQQVHEMLSKKSLSRSVQTEIENEDMDIFDEFKDKCASLEDQVDALQAKLRDKEKRIGSLQRELDIKNNEILQLSRSNTPLNIGALLQDQSIQQQVVAAQNKGSAHHSSTNSQSDETVISRLNARIAQLKQNEDVLLQELGKARQTNSSMTQGSVVVGDQARTSSNSIEERLAEFEVIVIEQSDKLIKLEEENASLRRQAKEMQTQNANQNEQAQLRIKNLQEINQKHEQLSIQTGSSFDSRGVKPGDMERLRQQNQQMQLQNIAIKHQNDELRVQLQQKEIECNNQKEDLSNLETALIKSRQDSRMTDSGLLQGQNLQQKLVEQRNQIKHLQGLLIRAKQDFDTQAKQLSSTHDNNQPSMLKFDEFSQTNEKLRREHHQAIMSLIDLKDEYTSKLQFLEDKHEQSRQKLLKENVSLARKVESLSVQMGYMEKKELRLFGQLEEAKALQSRESQEKEQRTKELEELLFKKEASIADLEREIRTKEKTLMERQEQISVLIGTLEGDNSRDELRQKVLNLSAELCSVRAIESQQVRKLNDMTLNLKKVELQSSKNLKALEQAKQKVKDQSLSLNRLEIQTSSLERQVQDLTMQVDEKEREVTDLKYQLEKEEFSLKLKEENINQAREQLKKAENLFKEEVERLRKEFFDQIQKDFEHQRKSQHFIASDVESHKSNIQFKTVLQQIHIILCEYLSKRDSHPDQESGQLYKEFEKALQVAAQTIERLQGDLDRTSFLTSRFKQDLKATVLNKVLMSRFESLNLKSKRFEHTLSTREQERALYFKTQEQSFTKIMRAQELKLQHLEQELKIVDEENQQLRDELRVTRDQKDEVEQTLVLFEQEIESKKQSMEKQAELTVDERFKAKHEIIKCYFDSQLTKILLNSSQSSSNEKMLELGREILALKLLVSKLEAHIVYEQSESQSLELSLAHYKESHSTLEQKIRDLIAKNSQLSLKSQQADASLKMELEKRKLEMITLQKEQIKCREVADQKSRECLILQDQLSKAEYSQRNLSEDSNFEAQISEYEHTIRSQGTQIQELQTKILELRSSHIQEIDSLRVQYDFDLSESKRLLSKERESLEKRYMPGHAPGDIQDENQELVRRLQDQRGNLDQILQENAVLKKKYENEKLLVDTYKREVDSYKQALIELEQTMIEMGHPSQSNQLQIIQTDERSGSRGRHIETERKTKKSSSRQKKLKLNRDPTTQSLPAADDSSLMTSVITNANIQQTMMKTSTSKTFILNPPAIVRALVQSKISELSTLQKFENLLQVELELRQTLKDLKIKELNGNQPSEDDAKNLQLKLSTVELENEDLKIQRALYQVDSIHQKSQYQPSVIDRLEYPAADYTTMLEAVLILSNQLSVVEAGLQQKVEGQSMMMPEGSQKAVEEAQRLVIRELAVRANACNSIFEIGNYQPPSEEQDRKLWYLELLEQQVNSSESVMQNLQTFIKKLQIDVQGNLQSAASIKSASMDLANNLKKTSDEVKTLKHVVALAKHDLAKLTVNSHSNHQKTLNPFSQTVDKHSSSSQSIYNQLMSQQDQIQNQLTISEKVKKSLEDEIVSLKIAHQQELSSLNTKLSQALDQRNSMLQSNEELHDRVEKLSQSLEDLRGEIERVTEENAANSALLLEKEREKQLMAQNKSATSKHLTKLQQDMQDWRKQTDENMKIKEKQIEDLQTQLSSLQKERDRLKSENLMLRRVDKDRRNGDSDDLRKLQSDNQELQVRLDQILNERKREMEFWVNERATMREMIEQLENEKVASNDIATVLPESNQDQVKQLKKKTHKKIKEMDLEIKGRERQIEDLKDEVHRGRQVETQLEQRLREANAELQDTEDRVKYLSQKVKEIELERDLMIAEKNNAINANDISAQQIQGELNSLRECFAKLKIERDNLLYEIESSNIREREWRQSVERLSEEVQKLESQISQRERDQGSQLRIIESKNQALLNDIKFMRDENEKMKEKLKSMESQIMQYESKLHTTDMKAQEALYSQTEFKRQVSEARALLRQREEEISDLHEQQLLLEGSKLREIEALQTRVEEIRESNSRLSGLYENQIQELRVRLISDKKKNEHQAEQIINLAQRDAVIKQLKKEVTGLKAAFTKVKAKNKEMKIQGMGLGSGEKENLSVNSGAQSASTKHSTARKGGKPNSNTSRYIGDEESQLPCGIDRSVIKLAQLLLTGSPVSKDESSVSRGMSVALYDNLQRYTNSAARIVELEAELEKYITLQALSKDQTNDLRQANEDLHAQVDDLSQRLASLQKEAKGQTGQQVRQMADQLESAKQQLKQAQQELLQLRQEWLPPSEAKSIQDRLKEAQNLVKQLKEEVQRKKEVIHQLKASKEQSATEAKEVAADLDSLKDDNAKLQRLIKENAKQMSLVGELKTANDQLRSSEKRLREEIVTLSDKLRSVKLDSQRKDTLIFELRDKIASMQDDISDSRDRSSEIDRLKELAKKLKLEAEIKENQVRTLKVKLEHFEGENEKLKQSQREESVEQQLETQLKATRIKLKKSEAMLRKSIEALKRIGKEVAASYHNTSRRPSVAQTSIKQLPRKTMQNQQEDQQMKQFYKDSVNILGMSMDELLDDFVAPKQSVMSSDLSNPNTKVLEQQLSLHLDRLNSSNSEEVCETVDQVCSLCIKLLNEINSNIESYAQSPK